MPTPYQLHNGNWIDLERIVGIAIDEDWKAIESSKVIVSLEGRRESIEIRPRDEGIAYRDELASAWVEATRPRESATYLPPYPEWDSIFLENLKSLGVPPSTGQQSASLPPGDKPIAFMGSPDSSPFIVKCDTCGAARVGKLYLGHTCGALVDLPIKTDGMVLVGKVRCNGVFISA